MITIKDIARKAHVSIGTVDRVLHGRGRFSKKTADKIKAIVKESGYKTNIHARNLSMKKTYRFGIIMPRCDQDSGYWEILKTGIDSALSDISSFSVNAEYFFFDKYSDDSFMQAGLRSLQGNVDGLLITPILSKICPSFVKAIPKEIPYVYADSTIPDTTPLAYIGQDSFQSGACAAKLMQLCIGGKGGIAVVRMLPEDFHINQRVKGFSSYFQNNSDITLHSFDASGGMNTKAFNEAIASIEKKLPGYQGVFVTNADTHRVAKALESSSGIRKHIVGYDCIKENMRLVSLGKIDFLISQKTRDQGFLGINTLFRSVVLKETCAKEVLMPIEIVTAENLRYYQ
jgi:LacI family transcriptional regulator